MDQHYELRCSINDRVVDSTDPLFTPEPGLVRRSPTVARGPSALAVAVGLVAGLGLLAAALAAAGGTVWSVAYFISLGWHAGVQ